MSDNPYNRRRKPGEVVSARLAIRYQCSECFGSNLKEVQHCTDPECWLFPWRLGTPEEMKPKFKTKDRVRVMRNLRHQTDKTGD